MSEDEKPTRRRARRSLRIDLPPGPARDLRDTLYNLYAAAGAPRYEDLATAIAADDSLAGAPGRDVLSGMISGREPAAGAEAAAAAAVVLARLAAVDPVAAEQRVRSLWAAMSTAPPGPGRPISSYDPDTLEVHRAVGYPADARLPTYVPRRHDQFLQAAVEAATHGESRMVTLVGGTSTGKTRACWEAVQRLPRRWRLWHPIELTQPGADVEIVRTVAPHTVIWLNDAQLYLGTADAGQNERLVVELRMLLANPERGPLLVLATLWPQHWSRLSIASRSAGTDSTAQARRLLARTDLAVPDAFTGDDLANARQAAATHPDLQRALQRADGGRITQYLAGVPEILRRYDNADRITRAVLDVAIDARRLGFPAELPRALFEQATPTYLTDDEWGQVDDGWLEQAFAYTAEPCNGVRGPLTPTRPRSDDATDERRTFRLADALEQVGRAKRAAVLPPAGFWDAAARVAAPVVVHGLGDEARDRGRYGLAVRLYRAAADRGEVDALLDLATVLLNARDGTGAETALRRAADQGHPEAVMALAHLRRAAGDEAGAQNAFTRLEKTGDGPAILDLVMARLGTGDRNALNSLGRLSVRGDDSIFPDNIGVVDRVRNSVTYGDVVELLSLPADTSEIVAYGVSALEALEVCEEETETFYRALESLLAGDPEGARERCRQAALRGETLPELLLGIASFVFDDRPAAEDVLRMAADNGSATAATLLQWISGSPGDEPMTELIAEADGGSEVVLGILAMIIGDRTMAEQILGLAVLRGSAVCLAQLANLHMWSGDRSRAEEVLRADTVAGRTTGLTLLARFRRRAGDFLGAEEVNRQVADLRARDGLVDLAYLELLAGDRAAARRRLDGLADQGHGRARMYLAFLEDASGLGAEADDLAMSAMDLTLIFPLAAARAAKHDFDGAMRLLELPLTLGWSGTVRIMAIIHEATGNRREAEACARRAAKRNDVEGLVDLAWMRMSAGDWESAQYLLTAAGERADDDPLTPLVRAADSGGDLLQAVRRHCGNVGIALCRLGDILLLSGDEVTAEQLYFAAADHGEVDDLDLLAWLRSWRADGRNVEAMFRAAGSDLEMAALREGAGDPAEAGAVARRSAERGQLGALWGLAMLRNARGDAAGAATIARAADDHGHPSALRDLATLRELNGDLAGAEELVREAVDRGQHAAVPLLIRLLERTGRTVAAERVRRFGLADDGTPGQFHA